MKVDLESSRQVMDAQKRLAHASNPYVQEITSTLTTSMPPSATSLRSTKKPKKKKKKKKKLRQHKISTTATTTTEATPPTVMALATTEMPWSTTQSAATAAKWRLVAERLFGPPWSQEDARDDDPNVAKVRNCVHEFQEEWQIIYDFVLGRFHEVIKLECITISLQVKIKITWYDKYFI